jgi:hypothetical protein
LKPFAGIELFTHVFISKDQMDSEPTWLAMDIVSAAQEASWIVHPVGQPAKLNRLPVSVGVTILTYGVSTSVDPDGKISPDKSFPRARAAAKALQLFSEKNGIRCRRMATEWQDLKEGILLEVGQRDLSVIDPMAPRTIRKPTKPTAQ